MIFLFLRMDRNSHVSVYQANVQWGKWHNFEMKEDTVDVARNTPYDYLSIMHYGKSSFAKIDSAVRIW